MLNQLLTSSYSTTRNPTGKTTFVAIWGCSHDTMTVAILFSDFGNYAEAHFQLREPYSFFIQVISRASTSYDKLARTNFGLPASV